MLLPPQPHPTILIQHILKDVQPCANKEDKDGEKRAIGTARKRENAVKKSTHHPEVDKNTRPSTKRVPTRMPGPHLGSVVSNPPLSHFQRGDSMNLTGGSHLQYITVLSGSLPRHTLNTRQAPSKECQYLRWNRWSWVNLINTLKQMVKYGTYMYHHVPTIGWSNSDLPCRKISFELSFGMGGFSGLTDGGMVNVPCTETNKIHRHGGLKVMQTQWTYCKVLVIDTWGNYELNQKTWGFMGGLGERTLEIQLLKKEDRI